MRYILTCLVWFSSLLATSRSDIDYLMVGSSPLMLIEAIYRSFQGYRVVVVEQAKETGGAWKSVSVCGVNHVDLGCHEFGKDPHVRQFFEEYIGCPMVENAPSHLRGGSWGFYPEGGCYALLQKLEDLLYRAGGVLWLNTKLEAVRPCAQGTEVKIGENVYLASHIVITRHSEITLDGLEKTSIYRYKYPHLYLLIADSTPCQFTYSPTALEGASRLMNVTPFTDLEGTGYQLIVVQLKKETPLQRGGIFLEEMKKRGLIGKEAALVQEESCIYEQGMLAQDLIKEGKPSLPVFEILDTNHITRASQNLARWKEVIPKSR